ncbi:ABC transporter ATP-binding protein [Moorella sp. Hama-1]|uniref:ABC transporter ATP-binding protein n=1 Tax=Moorella sp. Hama-1 TaxID=2138101 RepID=UPI000D64415C|nr:ABC transporter ATP-binding protein [Moorella sp. Hama-1]BCV22307.1 ABC transporter ATP-binding protein [Moorella sp. Hama-1]
MNILEIQGLHKRFGGIQAVADFSLSLPDKAIIGIIGPNGAGKTTIFNLISGIYKADGGRITLAGQDITNREQHQVARAGLSRTFQNIRLFKGLTVAENVMTAMDPVTKYSIFPCLLSLPGKIRAERETRAKVREYLELVDLVPYKDWRPENLPYGIQRRLEIARALATGPKVLLLDEPAAGLNPKEVADLIKLIGKLNRELGLAILLIEHRMEVVMQLCRYIYVQNFGKTLASGTPAEIQCNEEVIKAYLGDEG